MSETTEPALRTHATRMVGIADCASQWGNDGLDVLSTPAILGHMEQICVEALQPHLATGQMTVGVRVEMHHKAPTPLGAAVTFHITAPVIGRRITVAFTVLDDEGTVVCEGTHLRTVVDAADFRRSLPKRSADV